MATVAPASVPHEQRTATAPRQARLEPVVISHLRQINESIRLFRLSAVDPTHSIDFLPGQWVDTFVPGVSQAGGFTITSTPDEARPTRHLAPYIELAVQKSRNPPARALWRPEESLLNLQLVVRVGGSFTWPPPEIDVGSVDRLVLVAAGVGINPLISIFATLIKSAARPKEIHFLYGTKAGPELDPQGILFLPRLMDLVAISDSQDVTLRLFLTGTGDEGRIENGKLPNLTFARRMDADDLVRALDGFEGASLGAQYGRAGTLCYVCGPQRMTDETVDFLRRQEGMTDGRVLCEKWW
ncbi:oxidoreductase NAD-binding domain-containing protein 1 [Teratosphaeria destructans]|uniref:Oxidoreductase NAD-binding domain-containing protein 1 n=1 Tax=Teratosphaeria destructans TaxID=418781 RepID=A0A9W7SWV2_9PEZI|nr:oxidoreductase NAD-binding domain-containing protein 1 [Teratosphaeria destructans]